MLKSSRKNKGFSLLEVLITIGILSVGIVFVMQALSYSARATGVSSDIISAVFLLEDKLGELEYKEATKQVAAEEKNGKKDKFAWNYALNLDSSINLYKLDFIISWQRQNRQDNIEVGTYLR